MGVTEVIEKLAKWVRENPDAVAGDFAGEEPLTIARDAAKLVPPPPSFQCPDCGGDMTLLGHTADCPRKAY